MLYGVILDRYFNRLSKATWQTMGSREGETSVRDDQGGNQSPRQTRPERSNLQEVRDKIRRKERQVAEDEPEVHFVGQIEGAYGFGSGVCCRWEIEGGSTWEHISGEVQGQTQVDYPQDGDNAVWCHPVDVHFVAKAIHGWPRLLLQVWHLDSYGRVQSLGYGFGHLPSTPGKKSNSPALQYRWMCLKPRVGYHELEISTWRPLGTLKEEIAAQFLGSTPHLRDIGLLFKRAWSDRCRLTTAPSGKIQVNLDVVLKNFRKFNVDAIAED